MVYILYSVSSTNDFLTVIWWMTIISNMKCRCDSASGQAMRGTQYIQTRLTTISILQITTKSSQEQQHKEIYIHFKAFTRKQNRNHKVNLQRQYDQFKPRVVSSILAQKRKVRHTAGSAACMTPLHVTSHERRMQLFWCAIRLVVFLHVVQPLHGCSQ